MAGMAFGNPGSAIVHAMAYPLGGRFNIAHGVSNALLLPYVMKWNRESSLEKFRDIAEAMGIDTHGLSSQEASTRSRFRKWIFLPPSGDTERPDLQSGSLNPLNLKWQLTL